MSSLNNAWSKTTPATILLLLLSVFVYVSGEKYMFLSVVKLKTPFCVFPAIKLHVENKYTSVENI